MVVASRRRSIGFFIALGVGMISVIVLLYVGWFFLNLRSGILLFLGVLTSAQCLTTLAANPPFVPPAPYPSVAPKSTFWFGSDDLWTTLEFDGKWTAYAKGENGWVYQNKLVFWQRGFDWLKETEPKLIVTGKRLDGDAPTIAVAHANAVFIPSREAAGIMTLISVPKTGCWEITAHYKGHDLSFVVSVDPEAHQ